MLLVDTLALVLCTAFAAVGYGTGLSAFLKIEPNLGDRGILGLFTFGLLGCLLHFWIPLTPAVHILILALGCCVAVIFRRHLQFSSGVWAAAAVVLAPFESSMTLTRSGPKKAR